MLRINVDINGRGIGELAAINITGNQSGINTYEIYNIDNLQFGDSITEKGTKIGKLEHKYEDGAAKLIQKMMAEIETLPD